MEFKVISYNSWVPDTGKNIAYLQEERWDDWGQYQTMFSLVVFDSAGVKYEVGSVKIGQKGLLPGSGPTVHLPVGQQSLQSRSPRIPQAFTQLEDAFFSLGQGENYYETLNQLPEESRDEILTNLRDCAFALSIFERYKNEEVMMKSLMREVSESTIRRKFSRLARGEAVLTNFELSYDLESAVFPGSEIPRRLEFKVIPHSHPPTNVHVLIGRNGAGKTLTLQGLARKICEPTGPEDLRMPWDDDKSFAGLVIVAFSVFDSFEKRAASSGIKVRVVGAKRPDDANSNVGEPAEFDAQFCASMVACGNGPRKTRLQTALRTLASDPLFGDAGIEALLDLSEREIREAGATLFNKLSSGHKIILLTTCRLVEWTDERTVVLIDEPEGHLHPPLLSAFLRALSDLLVKRNGMAIIATHSPVVLQEVPKSCVSIISRTGDVARTDRPERETFGENVGTLTSEVFKLEVTKAGFHNLLREAVAEPGSTYQSVVDKFGGQVGAEAKAILMSMIFIRDREVSR